MKSKNNTMIKTYLSPLREDKIVTLKWVVFKGMATIYLMSIPWFIKYITSAVEQWNILMIKKYILFFIIYSLILFGIRALIKDWWWVTLWSWYKKVLQDVYIEKYIFMDNNYAESLGIWKAIAIINKWIDVRGKSLKDGVERVTEISIGLISTFVILFTVWWYYPFILLVFIILSLIFAYYQNKKILLWRRERKEISVQYTNHIVKLFMSKFEVVQSDKWLYEKGKIYTYMFSTIEATKKYSLLMLNLFFWSRVVLNIASIWIIWIIGIQVVHHFLSFADFASVITVLTLINSMINRLLSYFKNVSRDRVHVEKMLNFFDSAPEIDLLDNQVSFVYKEWKVILKDLSFWYEWNLVFEKLSLDISSGEKTAFVWPSGVGKSTLIKLIAWYLQTDDGEIIVDGQKLSEVSLKSYYKYVGYLTQEPSIFDGTIYENLTYALDFNLDENNSQENLNKKMEQVIKDAKCEFIYDFPKWMETEIGERGIRLSWGQKQRLAIAKIMLKNPSIILLDEPTSALDSFNEEQINIALENLFRGKTVIIVAHRLQTVKQSDKILFFENGKVIEEWNHEELIKLDGQYKKMLDLQSWF